MTDVQKPVRVKLSELKPYSGNPRHITRQKMESLKASLRMHGMVTAVVARKGSMELIGGHQRVQALQQLKAEGEKVPQHVWAVLVDISDDKARELNVALNRTGGEFDEELLADIFKELDEITEESAQAMGYTTDEIDTLIAEYTSDDGVEDDAATGEKTSKRDLQEFANSVTLSVSFSSVDQRDAVKEWLAKRASTEDCKAGDILFRISQARPKKRKKK